MILSIIKRYLDLKIPEGQSCFLWGARKTGKSTYLKESFPDALYIDLLQADIFQRYMREPQLLRQEVKVFTQPKTIIIDEVQKVTLLLDEVHGLIESEKHLQFILCGSSARRIKTMGANLLGGRAWRSMFVPFCYPELKELNWSRIFNNGLVPSHYFSDAPDRSLAAYLYDYVLTEVQVEANIRKRDSFSRFLDVLGFAQGEMLSYTNIARDCGVDSKTVRTYFEILEDMYLGYFLYPYRTISKRQTIQETPKFYLFDTGVATYLRRFEFKEMVGPEAGKAFEHYIFLELMAYKLLTNKRDEITYWRTKEGKEVDFIVSNMAFEVKISTPIKKSQLSGLLAFGEEQPHSLHVISLEPRKRIMTVNEKEITIWPVQEFLISLWNGELW
jgi:predicted AAA+ superfamily ATPase